MNQPTASPVRVAGSAATIFSSLSPAVGSGKLSAVPAQDVMKVVVNEGLG